MHTFYNSLIDFRRVNLVCFLKLYKLGLFVFFSGNHYKYQDICGLMPELSSIFI